MTRFWVIVLLVCGIGLGAAPVWADRDASIYQDNAKIYLKEGLAHEQAGRYKDAIKAYNKSRQYKRSQTAVSNHLGVCHAHLRRYKQAAEHYTYSLWLNPKQVEIRAALGELYVTMKQFSLATKEYRALRFLDAGAAETLKHKIDVARASKKRRYWFW